MQQAVIGPDQAGQRLDKYLRRLLPGAPDSFLYKMLRKKNLTLNGKKAEGKEILLTGDEIKLFFSEETYGKFAADSRKTEASEENLSQYSLAYRRLHGIGVVYEDPHVLILNKPAGILSQKSVAGDLSLNEWMIGYLLQNGSLQEKDFALFRPSVCNRLDRNTSGLVLCGKTLAGSQGLSWAIRERHVGKFYRTIVLGWMEEPCKLEGYLTKDERNNRVSVAPLAGGQKERVKAQNGKTGEEQDKQQGAQHGRPGEAPERSPAPVRIACRPLSFSYPNGGGGREALTCLEVELLTGKSHQIRAQLAEAGFPLLGDYKYGVPSVNDRFKAEYGLPFQLLHACRLEFPGAGPEFLKKEAMAGISGKTFEAPLPGIFSKILKEKNFR